MNFSGDSWAPAWIPGARNFASVIPPDDVGRGQRGLRLMPVAGPASPAFSLLAERQMGEFLKQMPKATGAKGVGPIAVPDENRNQPATLAAIGITKKQSSTAQKLAAIPAKEFEERIAQVKADGDR